LERGESASQTGRDHIPLRVFKEMTNLTRQRERIETLLTGINPFNAKSKAGEISKLLDTYIPAVEKMNTMLTKYNVAFTNTITENKSLKKRNVQLSKAVEASEKQSVLKQLEDSKLRMDYQAAIDTLEHIPTEVLEMYTNGVHVKSNEHRAGR